MARRRATLERYLVNVKPLNGSDFWHTIKLRTGGLPAIAARGIVQAALVSERTKYKGAQIFIFKK